MTKKQLDRALLKLFNLEDPCVRMVMAPNLYDYAQKLWAKSKAGRRALGGKR